MADTPDFWLALRNCPVIEEILALFALSRRGELRGHADARTRIREAVSVALPDLVSSSSIHSSQRQNYN
jgi:hypothetical protein